jgi:putative oxidoreductase
VDDSPPSNAIAWVLAALLAAIFLSAGIPKIFGTGTVWLEAATMRAFPSWLRTVVGLAEVAGAIALLVPRLTKYAALGLALLMIPAAITQEISGQPGVYVPIIVFILLIALAERRDPAAVRAAVRSIADAPHPTLRKGIIAGAIGATIVAAWFFIVDLAAGRPLFTPTALGQALLTLLRPTPTWATPAVAIVIYTVVHYAAFIVVGTIAAIVAGWANEEPAILLGFVILAFAFEVGFYGLVAVLQQSSALGTFAWYQVMIGNLLAAAGMGNYLWRAHPKLREQFTHALDAPA